MSEDTLYTALLAAQRAMGPVVKNATNPHLKSKYADLGAVLDTIEGPLWANGLLVIQRFTHDQGGAILVTELIHAASGETLTSAVPVVSKDPTDPQKIGAAITYYRRYSLLALLGLAPEDDDGHAASQPARQNTATPPPAFTRPRETPTAAPAPTDSLAMARQHALKQFGPLPATLPEVEAQLAPLAKQVRTDDEALSPGEYQRYHDLEARRKELDAVSNKRFTAADFEMLMDGLWQLAEDGAALARIKDELNGSRHRMTREMMDEARLALAKIEAKFCAPAGIAG